MKHNFEERKQNRIDYAREQAEKNEATANALNQSAREMSSHIPLGQPILVGHHSERADRNHRAKISNTFQKSAEASNKVGYYKEKAKTIENNRAIFSDDPQALEKIEAKITQMEKLQDFMKSANKLVKKQDKEGFLKLVGATERLWEKLNEPDFLGSLGYASYKLTNNNANIRRLKERKEGLVKMQGKETESVEIKGVKMVQNVDANRVQLFFDSIPSENVRQKLKKSYGFRWCRSEGAWQRHLSNAGIYASTQFLEWYQENNA